MVRRRSQAAGRAIIEYASHSTRELGAVHFHVAMLSTYLADDGYRGRGVYHVDNVDNHLWPYTGKRTCTNSGARS